MFAKRSAARGGRAGLVEHGGGAVREEFTVAAGLSEAVAEIRGGVRGDEGLDLQAPVDARVERAIAERDEALLQLGQTDKDEGEQGFAVPLVVTQDVDPPCDREQIVRVVKSSRAQGQLWRSLPGERRDGL